MSAEATLSPTHTSMLKVLRRLTGETDLSISPAKTMAAADYHYKKSSVVTALSMLRAMYPKSQFYIDEMKKRSATQNIANANQTPTEEAIAKSVDWDDLITWRDAHMSELSPIEKLLICLYTMIAPVRADFTPMAIVASKPKKLAALTNYLVWNKTPYFFFHAYKTHDTYGDVRVNIPAPLKRVLSEWIATHPGQTYLLEDRGAPWLENRLTVAVQKIFQKHHQMDTTIMSLRHSYLTKYYTGMPLLSKMNKIAKSMMHSVVQGQKYRYPTLE